MKNRGLATGRKNTKCQKEQHKYQTQTVPGRGEGKIDCARANRLQKTRPVSVGVRAPPAWLTPPR